MREAGLVAHEVANSPGDVDRAARSPGRGVGGHGHEHLGGGPLARELTFCLLQSDHGRRLLDAAASSRSDVVTRTIDLVAARLDAPWSLDFLASEVGTSTSTLTRRVREVTTMSPMHLKRLRLGEVRRMLVLGDSASGRHPRWDTPSRRISPATTARSTSRRRLPTPRPCKGNSARGCDRERVAEIGRNVQLKGLIRTSLERRSPVGHLRTRMVVSQRRG